MSANVASYFELTLRRLASNTSATSFNRTRLWLDDGWFDGSPVCRPAVVASNTDSSDRDVLIVDNSDATLGSVTIPASTSAATLFLGSSTFSLQSGNLSYRIRTEGTTSASQLSVGSAGFIVEQTAATKSAFQRLLLCSREAGVTNSDVNGYLYASNPTSFAVHDPKFAARWQKVESRFGDTIDGWRFYAVIRGTTGSNLSEARLYNETDASVVTGTTLSTASTTIVSLTADISNSAVNFDDTDDFRTQWRSSSALNTVQLYGGGLICRVSSLTAAESWFPVTHSNAFSGSANIVAYRKKYEPSKFTASAVYFHVQGYCEGTATGTANLKDGGTSDSGTSPGTTVSSLSFSSGDNYKRSADITASLTVDNRYYFQGDRPTGGVLDDFEVQGAYLAVEIGPTLAETITETFDWSESPATEMYDFLSYSPSPPEAFDWTESPRGAVYEMASPSEMSESLAFTESPRWSVFGFLSPSPIGETFDWQASPLEYELGNYYGPGPLVLAEIWLDAGTEYESNIYVKHPTRIYEGRVTSFGTVDRSLPVPSGFPEVGDARIEIADTDNKFRALFSVKTPRRRLVVLKMGQEGSSEALFQIVWIGEVKTARFPAGKAIVEAQDITFQFFEENIPKLITADNFNLTEELSEAFSPIVFGQVFSAGLTDQGAWDCPRLSERRYNVARHPMASVQVYRKVPLAEVYTLVPFGYQIIEEEKTIDGVEYTFTHIEFNQDQEDGTLVRADGEGRLDGSSPPVLERNPAAAIKDFLLNIAHRPWNDLNHIAFSDLEATLDTLLYYCDGAIVTQMTYREALSRLVKSFNLDFYQDKDGRISIGLVTGQDPNRPVFDDTLLIERDSVVQMLADPFANKLRYNYNRLVNEWYTELIYDNTVDQTALGEEEEKVIDLWFVRDPSTANAVINDYASYLDLASHRIEFRTPTPRTLHMMELAKLIGVTHYAGLDPGGAGFTNREFKIYQISHDLNELKTTIKAIRRNALAEQKALLTGFWTTNAVIGPWMGPAPGILYVVPAEDFTGTELKVMRSLDWGATWSRLATPTTTNIIGSHDTKADGIFLHIAIQEDTTGRVSYWKYNMASEGWEVENEQVAASFSPLGVRAVSIDVWDRTGEPIIFCQKERETVASIEYDRVTAYRRSSSGSWTNVNVGQPGVTGWNRICRVVCVGDRAHFFFGYNHGVGGGLRDEYHQTLRANYTLGSDIRWLVGNSTYYGANVQHNMGKPAVTEEGLTIPFKGWWGEAYITGFTSADNLEAAPVKTLVSGTFLFQGAGASGLANYPAMCMDYIGSELQIVFAHFSGFNRWEVHKTGGGPTPGPTGASAAANQCGPRFPWPTNEPQMTNSLVFRYGTGNWIAKVFSTGSGTIGFELVDVTNLPRATTYTISDFLAEAT